MTAPAIPVPPPAASPDELILEARGLTKQFGGLLAVKSVDFTIPRGAIVSLIGPNGAGKTTLFNVVAGLLDPTAGYVAFEGTRRIARPVRAYLEPILWVIPAIIVWLIAYAMGSAGNQTLLIAFVAIGFLVLMATLVSAITRPAWYDRLLIGLGIFKSARPNEMVRTGIGRTFQNIRLFANMTALENVMVGMHSRLRATPADAALRTPRQRREEDAAREEARKWLRYVGLRNRDDEVARNLPYGDQRRLEVARALASKPRLLLLDEPTAGMNPSETSAMMALFSRIRKELGITILLIEHDMRVVMGISDRVTVLDHGEKIAEGAPSVVRDDPRVIEAYLGKGVAGASAEKRAEVAVAQIVSAESAPSAAQTAAPVPEAESPEAASAAAGADAAGAAVPGGSTAATVPPASAAGATAEGGASAAAPQATSPRTDITFPAAAAGVTAARPTLLRLNGVNAFYGHIHALQGVSMDVGDREIVTLLGGNGAGKSTTLKTISGLMHPRTGTVEFEGKDISSVPAFDLVRRGIGHVPEGRRIFSRMTVLENLQMGAYANTGGAMKGDFDRVFALFPRLAERRGQAGGTLSGGEQQMLAIGRALMGRPKLLLLDEPSMGLAPVLVEQIFSIISDINAQGMTILLVEQNALMALQIATRGYILQTGRVVLADTSVALAENEDVKRAYLGG